MSINDAQQVVEIVSDPARELTDCFHLLCFAACIIPFHPITCNRT
jgi:hypothetical protein